MRRDLVDGGNGWVHTGLNPSVRLKLDSVIGSIASIAKHAKAEMPDSSD